MSRLRTVERVREILERRALGRYGRARAEAARRAEQREEAQRAYRARPAPPPTVSPAELHALQLQGQAAHEIVRDTLRTEELAKEREDELQRAWSMASIDRKSVERAADRRDEETSLRAARAAERSLDELAVARRLRQDRGEGGAR